MRITDEYVFFWGEEDFLSNFFMWEFEHQGITFHSSEQAIMYRKAMLFGAEKIAKIILECEQPYECKGWGRSREIPFNEQVWVANREKIYKEVLLDKFNRHQFTGSMLLATRNRVLVEASPYDRIWGVGLGENDARIEDPRNWRGLNLLGKVLMEVREELGY